MMTHSARWIGRHLECLENHLDHQDHHHHAQDQVQDWNMAQVQVHRFIK